MRQLRTMGIAYSLIIIAVAWGCSSSTDQSAEQEYSKAKAASLTESGFEISSTEFRDTRPRIRFPMKYTCYGENISPPLSWTGAPDGTLSFVLIAEDIDHGIKRNNLGMVQGTSIPWVHWILYNIPAETNKIAESIPTSTPVLPDGTVQGNNHFKQPGYFAPCPPKNISSYNCGIPCYSAGGEAAHRYRFIFYALDKELGLDSGANKKELQEAMEGHILAESYTQGRFSTALVLDDKGGAGFLETKGMKESDLKGTPTPLGAKPIYNTYGALITPTPSGSQ